MNMDQGWDGMGLMGQLQRLYLFPIVFFSLDHLHPSSLDPLTDVRGSVITASPRPRVSASAIP